MPQVETYVRAELKRSMVGHKNILERSMHDLWSHVEKIATKAHHDILQIGGSKQEADAAYHQILNWINTKI